TAGWDGGAVYNSGTVSISDSTFSGNSAMGDGGGGAVYNGGTVSISDSTFSGNSAWYDGGAFCNYSHATATISDSVFTGNAAESGGAVFNCGIVTISDSVFSGNATSVGGAVYNDYSGIITISDSVFSGNSAWYDGGAIYNTGTATIKNSVFETATDTIYNDGGTLVLGGTIRTAANITADKEVAVQDDTELIVDLSSYTTSEGVTEWFTGYDRMFGSTNNTQQNFSLTVNVSDETYGAYVLATGADKFDKTITVVCDAYDEPLGTLSLAAGTFTSHGKYCTLSRANGNVTLTIVQDQGIVTPDRSIIQVEIDGKNYSGRWYNSINTALQSEVTVVAQGVNKSEHVEVGLGNRKLIADHIVIAKAENIHVFSGGAINTVASAVMEITGSTFSKNGGNYVQRDGGAICSHGTTTIKNSLFIQNSVDDLGGGLYCNGTTEVVGSTFSSNHAVLGAGIFNEGNAIITGCVFLNNHGPDGGGGICNYASATVSGCTFSGNSSYYYYNGGAIRSVSRRDASANITVRDCCFLTALDSIRCTDYDAVMTLGGTIWTAAQIDSHNGGSIRVESGTDLILDVSVSLPGATETAILYGYDRIEGASENLSITVNIAQEQAVGIYRLVANASTFDGTITLDIEKESVASLDFITKVVLGERAYRLNRHKTYSNNDVQLVVEDVSDGKVFGGGTVFSDTVISEATGVKIMGGGSFIAAAGGVYAKNAVISVNADTSVSVENGYFSNIVCAGSVANKDALLTVNADSVLTITGGTFANAVAGGNYIQYDGGTVYGGRDEKASDTRVSITGGTFLRDVFGGNISAKNEFSTTTSSYITGSTDITIDAGKSAVFIGGNVIAGSSGMGQILGSTHLTFKGTGSNLAFGNTSIVCGDSHDATISDSCVGAENTVRRFLTFDGFAGTLDAKVVGFDQATFSGSTVTLGNDSQLSRTSVWDFSAGATLTFGDITNNFRGDTLRFDACGENEWTVISGSDSTLANWDNAASVTIAGQTASFKDGCWTSDDYKFYKEDNALKVAKLA
ncbi:MAG: right-handed parallel beta-helix repeat-containing protein, partial [Victivallaceae bacterium]|nr:right-handed parallel beta-helix repeat-containing protein [Victivallaceae bacterium]